MGRNRLQRRKRKRIPRLKPTTMEEAILKLMKVEAAKLAALYQCGCDAEIVVNSILTEASLKIHEEARQELIDYFKTLN